MIPEVKARFNALWEQLLTMADDAPPAEGRRVYQFAIQLLPVSQPVD